MIGRPQKKGAKKQELSNNGTLKTGVCVHIGNICTKRGLKSCFGVISTAHKSSFAQRICRYKKVLGIDWRVCQICIYLMLYLAILLYRVRRLIPRILAAFFRLFPLTDKARTTISRSTSCNGVPISKAIVGRFRLAVLNLGGRCSGSNTSPGQTRTARWITFFSSRTLPGHRYPWSRLIHSGEIPKIFFW